MNLFDSLDTLLFLKEEELAAFKRIISGNRIVDLLLYIPSYYKAFEMSENFIDDLKKGQEVNLNNCKIIKIDNNSSQAVGAKYRKIPFVVKILTDKLEEISLIFFQISEYYKVKFKLNEIISISGKIEDYKGKKSISHPKVQFEIKSQGGSKLTGNNIIKIVNPREDLEKEEEDELGLVKKKKNIDSAQVSHIEAYYSLTEGLSNFLIKRTIKKILTDIKNNSIYSKFLHLDFEEYQGLPTFFESIERVHFPLFINDISFESPFFKRLATDEVFANQITMNLARKEEKIDGFCVEGNSSLVDLAVKNLPFELTEDQKGALDEIFHDQKQSKKMFRLLQGDVGSGKTIVAILAALNAIEAGYKVAILAPTSILASQHFETITAMSSFLNVSAELLTGGTGQKSKKNLASMIRLGFIDILVGTHALLYSDVDFSKFGLFIIDEQHNFGVEQRNALNNKNEKADLLMMSATPIPRTLLMSYYGDLKISLIKTRPKNRKKIETKIMSSENYLKILNSIKNIIEKEEKVYWVCPLVQESEKLSFQDAVSRYESICDSISKEKVGLVHGGMSEKEKDEIMEKFANGNMRILVCTTVIEVGVNVPDATVIVIENANKFGLAQLHQLRGRVGRSHLQSYCILLYDKNISQKGKKRLEILKESNDGFYIAEQDLKMRGGGNILGKEQSGFNIFKIASFFNDKDIIYKISYLSKQIANNIIKNDILLEETEDILYLRRIFCDGEVERFMGG